MNKLTTRGHRLVRFALTHNGNGIVECCGVGLGGCLPSTDSNLEDASS